MNSSIKENIIENIIENNKSDKMNRIFFSIFVFVFLLFKFIKSIPYSLYVGENCILPYILSYSDSGLGTRFLIGSVIRIFKDYITVEEVHNIGIIISILSYVLISIIVYKVLANIESKYIYLFECITILAISFPYLTMLGGRFYMFTEEFMLALALIAITIITCSKSIFGVTLSIFLIIISLLNHVAFLFMFFPLIFIVLLYKLYIIKLKGFNNSKATIYVVLFTIIVLTFSIYLMFFTEKNVNVDTIISAIEKHSNYKLPYMPNLYLKWEYEYNLLEKFLNSTYGFLKNKTWLFLFLITLFIDIIIYLHFVVIYVDSYKNTNEPLLKFIYTLPILMFFAVIPLFVGCDLKRWLDTAIICQFVMLIYFVIVKDKNILLSIEKIYYSKDKLYFIALMILFLLSCIDNNELGFSATVAKVFSFFKKIVTHNH